MTGARIKKIITGVPVFIYAFLTLFILLKGIVYWNGGDRAYDGISPDILRGVLMLLSLSFFVFAISFLYKITDKIPADKLRLFFGHRISSDVLGTACLCFYGANRDKI